MKRRRLELPRHNRHYPLKVARLPIPPPLHCQHVSCCRQVGKVPRTGLEPARLSTLAPETSASTIPPPGRILQTCVHMPCFLCAWSGKRDSNSRPRPWQGRALPTELLPHVVFTLTEAIEWPRSWGPSLPLSRGFSTLDVVQNVNCLCQSPDCGCKGTAFF